ncbi:MAG: hypothetical protein CVT88_07375 [Candidatus Altiarchaeales archaeon HGW-Altiarchaeales-1]|nr:MAG: hypothetical protein CVT88_07375 [Candidatus Altiarchaeales archaeon HGW-Altiarchaeales-1]
MTMKKAYSKRKKKQNKPKQKHVICKYLFDWDDVPGKDDKKLKDFLKERFYISWVKNAKIEKSKKNGEEVISVVSAVDSQKFVNLRYKKDEYKVTLKTDKNLCDELIVRKEDNLLKIYCELITIENILASIKLNLEDTESDYIETCESSSKKLNLKRIMECKDSGFIYDKCRFPCLVYRIKNPELAMLVFNSGNIICTGAKKEEDVYRAKDILFGKFESIGIHLNWESSKVHVQNIVASAMFYSMIDLDILADCENTGYEPEIFSGLTYKLKDPKTAMLIFRSGKIVITGAGSTEAAIMAAEKTKKLIMDANAIIVE